MRRAVTVKSLLRFIFDNARAKKTCWGGILIDQGIAYARFVSAPCWRFCISLKG